MQERFPKQRDFDDTVPADFSDTIPAGVRDIHYTYDASPEVHKEREAPPPRSTTGSSGAAALPEEYPWLQKGSPRPSWLTDEEKEKGTPATPATQGQLAALERRIEDEQRKRNYGVVYALEQKLNELRGPAQSSDDAPLQERDDDDKMFAAFDDVPAREEKRTFSEYWRGKLQAAVTELKEWQDIVHASQRDEKEVDASVTRERAHEREVREKRIARGEVVPGMIERGYRALSGYLSNRLDELDKQSAQRGALEKVFRSWGERYNKLGWKSKLAVGVSLGIGSGVALSFASLPAAALCLSGVAAQRIAGMSSAFLKYENQIQVGRFKKERALGRATRDAAVMTGGMMLLVDQAKDATDWVRQHWPFGSATPSTSAPTSASASMPVEASPYAHIVPADVDAPPSLSVEVPVTVETPAIPTLSVEATPGKGVEFMTKRLWEQLQEKALDPKSFAEGSDIRRLLEADAKSIDAIVHRIAVDPSHGFVRPDGSSVTIGTTAKLVLDASGRLLLTK